MNDILTNHLNSVKTCIGTANHEDNRSVWDGVPPLAFATDLDDLTTDCNAAEEIAARAASAAKGYADSKKEAEDQLERVCFKTARALASFFKNSGDLTRRAKVDHKMRYFKRLRDQNLITAARDLITIGTTAATEPGAADRGVTPALMAQLTAALAKFDDKDPTPRTGIVSRSTLLKDLEAKIASLMEQLDDLDDLVVQYDDTAAGRHFIAAWKQARIIVDAGHGPSNDDEDPTAEPPTPTA
jgi:hypothetical protein